MSSSRFRSRPMTMDDLVPVLERKVKQGKPGKAAVWKFFASASRQRKQTVQLEIWPQHHRQPGRRVTPGICSYDTACPFTLAESQLRTLPEPGGPHCSSPAMAQTAFPGGGSKHRPSARCPTAHTISRWTVHPVNVGEPRSIALMYLTSNLYWHSGECGCWEGGGMPPIR